MTKTQVTYADAGVNIDAGNALVERIKPLAKSTLRPGVMGGLGGFGALFDLKGAGYKDPILVSGTDGVGTKIKIAQQLNRHDTIGIDLVAMSVNDLIVQGAEPLFFLDYFATSTLDVSIAEQVVAGIAEGCKQAGCALVGGETAEMPGIYQPGEYDLAGFAVGAVERDQVLPAGIKQGDVVVGLASSGVHSNGYSLVRHLVKDWNAEAPFAKGKTLGDIFLTPTRIYIHSCLKAIRAGGVKALVHITGGGITENTPRILVDEFSVEIARNSWALPPLFSWLQQQGNVDDAEMLRTFNCGIGMILVVDAARSKSLCAVLEQEGETVYTLGRVIARQSERVVYV